MATDTQTIARNEFKLQMSQGYKLISWYEAAQLSNRSSALFRLPIPLNLVLRCRLYATVHGIAYLRKRLQEGKALHVYIPDSHLQGHTLQLLDAHGPPASGAGNHDGKASGLQITVVKVYHCYP
jgi:hypothetical protein